MISAQHRPVWISSRAASAWIDVSEVVISQLAVPWQDTPVPHRIRCRFLVLEEGGKGEPRYFASDLERLLSGHGPAEEIPVNVEQEPVLRGAKTRHRRVERGIYRDIKSQTLFERPFIGGKRTCRSLGTTKVTEARKELRRRKAARLEEGKDAEPEYLKTVGEVILYYQKADYPDKQLNPRTERTRKEEARHCVLLLKFWDSVRTKLTSIVTCDKYRDWRLQCIKQGTGLRTIDRELMTLHNAFRFA